MGPAAGVGLHRHGDPGGVQADREAEGHQNTLPRPVLPAAQRQGSGGKEVLAVEADLALLHTGGGVGEGGLHPAEEGLVQRQLRRLAVKKEQDVALVVFGCFHSGAPPCLNRVSPCGGGGALRPGAASAGFGVEDSGSFVAKTVSGFWEDSTRLPEYYNGTYQYLKSLGIEEI